MSLNELKVRAAIWMHNYRQFGRDIYLNHAIADTRRALAIHITRNKEEA